MRHVIKGVVLATMFSTLFACNSYTNFVARDSSQGDDAVEEDPENKEANPKKNNPPSKKEPKTRVEEGNFSFTADSEEFRPLIRMIFVVDNSLSMAAEQTILSDSVNTLLNGIKANAEFHVLTTEDKYHAANPAANLTQYIWDDAGMEKVATALPAPITYPYTIKRSYNWMPPAVTPIELKSEMNETQVAEVRTELSNRIRAVGTAGPADEKPLCTALRSMDHIKGGIGAFIFMTDEDDNTAANCKVSSTQVMTYGTKEDYACTGASCDTVCTNGGCKRMRSYISYQRAYIRYQCETFNDGVPVPTLGTANATVTTCLNNSLCTNFASACNTEQINFAQPYLNGNASCSTKEMKSCNVVESPVHEYVDYPANSVSTLDYCTQPYTRSGTTYDNVTKYYESIGRKVLACRREGIKDVPSAVAGSLDYQNQMQAGETAKDAFIRKADATYGRENYFVSAIARNSDTTNCPTNEPYKVATILQGIVDLKGNLGNFSSLCNPSYSEALKKVENYVQLQLSSSIYEVKLAAEEEIVEVYIERDGDKIELKIGADVLIKGNTVNFKDGALLPTDKIHIKTKKTVVIEDEEG